MRHAKNRCFLHIIGRKKMVAFVAKARVILPHRGGVRGENFRVFRGRRGNIRFIGLFRKPAVDRRKQEKQREKARGGKRREK